MLKRSIAAMLLFEFFYYFAAKSVFVQKIYELNDCWLSRHYPILAGLSVVVKQIFVQGVLGLEPVHRDLAYLSIEYHQYQ